MRPRTALDYSVTFAHVAPETRLHGVEAGARRRDPHAC